MSAESSSSGMPLVNYLNVAVSETGLSEFQGTRRVLFIPRETIHTIELKHGLQSERPLLQTILGAALVFLGLGGAWILAEADVGLLRWGAGFLVFGGVGAWLLWEALRRGHYLRVQCSDDTRKLPIRGAFREGEFTDFITSATSLGYHFRDCLP